MGLVLELFVPSSSAAAATLLVITPHPDDAEASCGGLIANSVAAGDRVVILTMTGGELGIGGKSPGEARAIRTEEARGAGAMLGAQVEFFGAIDGSLTVDGPTAAHLKQIELSLRPDVVVAPWPLDVHPDHQATGLLAWRVFQDRDLSHSLYFYETANMPHTMSFRFVPTDYADISEVMARKRAATLQHRSQNPASWFGQYESIARVRGYEADVPLAEAFVRARNSSGLGGRAGAIGKTLSPGP